MAEKIIYTPRQWTYDLHESPERWKVIIVHRRGGKTTACINHLIRDAMRVNGSRYAYIAPTYKQAKNVAWDLLKEFARQIEGVSFNESELRADFANGSRITLFGADNPDALRGLALWGVIFDEYSQQPSNIFTEVIRPALADNKGYGIWIGTPKGKNDFYRLYKEGQELDNWLTVKLTVNDTGVIDDDELEDARRSMSEDEFNQEFLCEFDAHIKGAVYRNELSKAREQGRIMPFKYDETLPVVTAWDLGMSDHTAIGFFQKVGNEIRLFDYYANNGESLKHYINVLDSKGYRYSEHILPHDIKVRELGTGKSRLEVLQSMGLDNITVCKNLGISDGINAVRVLFNRLYINSELGEMLDALAQYRYDWNDKLGRFKDKPVHDWTSHTADMLRYYAVMDRLLDYNVRKRPTHFHDYSGVSHEISTY